MRGKWRAQRADRGAHAARGFVGGAACTRAKLGAVSTRVSMPHAALWVVQQALYAASERSDEVSMPHAALWVVQQEDVEYLFSFFGVSMPHAALWVVQPQRNSAMLTKPKFQCRTRLFPFAPTTASRSPSPARAGEAWLRAVFSQNHAISASPADAGEVASAASR